MSAGGEALLPRDAWPGPASNRAEASGPDAWSQLAAVDEGVWIIDPQTLFRRGLTLLLRQWNSRLGVADMPDIGAALLRLDRRPALVLVDASSAGQGHFAGLARLIAEARAAPVVLLAGDVDWKTAAKAVELGARGYVPKSASEEVLRHALGLVLSGEVYLPRGVLTRWTERRQEAPRSGGRAVDRLTPRQSEVLAQLTLGLSNKEIARALGLLESTVKVHVKTILKKLAASNRTQAAMMALDLGLAHRAAEPLPRKW
jgi:DNA-binding NarL/FixJ family response regulator